MSVPNNLSDLEEATNINFASLYSLSKYALPEGHKYYEYEKNNHITLDNAYKSIMSSSKKDDYIKYFIDGPNDQNSFSIDTNPFLATIAIIILVWRCVPYILELDELDEFD